MATNLHIDEHLLEEALVVGKHRSKKDAVNTALKEYVQRHKKQDLKRLFGTLDWDDSYDYKTERKSDNEDLPAS